MTTRRAVLIDELDSLPAPSRALTNKLYSLQHVVVTIRQTLDAQKETYRYTTH